MSLFNAIQNILLSVQSGNPLNADQYKTLATSSESETVKAVGSQNANVIEAAYNSYVQEVVLPQVESPLVLCSDGEGNEWYERK